MLLDKSSKAERARRLRYLRQVMGLSIESLAKLTGFSQGSLSFWERGLYSGLPQKAAAIVSEIAVERNVLCTDAWLLLGIGNPPYKINPDQIKSDDSTVISEHPTHTVASEAESAWFLAKYPYAVVTQINHHAMAPIFNKSDWVGGCWAPVSQLAIPEDGISCIVEIAQGIQVRILHQARYRGLYDLRFNKFDANTALAFSVQDIPLERAAPVTRLWRES